MSIEKERKVFIEEIKKNKYFLNVCKIKGLYPYEMLVFHTDGNFKFSDARLAFEAWQASANREGYKLVPVEPTDDMLNIYEKYSIAPIGKLSKRGYKAMIGACDDH